MLLSPTLPRRPDIDAAATRREFLAMLAAAGLLAGCASDDEPDAAPSPTPAGRQVPSDNGPVEVPRSPTRVVAAFGSFETDMVAVGVMPVLTTTFAGPWVDLDDAVIKTANIPPTAEELLKVRPDLIVGWNWVTKEAVYDEITAIAPYVGPSPTPATRTITHQLGTVEVPVAPARVVAMSDRDADTVIALGVKPVGIHSRYGFADGVGPWAIDALCDLGDPAPAVWLGREFNYEAVASVRPDLIVYANSGLEQTSTTTSPRSHRPWPCQREPFPTARPPSSSSRWSRRPWTARRTATASSPSSRTTSRNRLSGTRTSAARRSGTSTSSPAASTPTRPTVNALMYEVGFDPTEASAAADREEVIEISPERLAEFDADVMLAYPFGRSFDDLVEENPTLTSLESVEGDRFFVLEDLALSNASPLSVPYALDRLLPRIAESLDATPTSTVSATPTA